MMNFTIISYVDYVAIEICSLGHKKMENKKIRYNNAVANRLIKLQQEKYRNKEGDSVILYLVMP